MTPSLVLLRQLQAYLPLLSVLVILSLTLSFFLRSGCQIFSEFVICYRCSLSFQVSQFSQIHAGAERSVGLITGFDVLAECSALD